MYTDKKIWIGWDDGERIAIEPRMANRHGLIAGATGTGKTITLKVLAESFSDAGVPVFLADVKGDLSGMCLQGMDSENMQKRIEKFELADAGFQYTSYPTTFWDIFGKGGIPLRTTVSEMGPVLLSKLLELNDTQADIMTVIFKIADDEQLLLVDTKDLKSMLTYVGDHNKEYADQYGNIAKQSIGAILRGIVALEAQGGEFFFGEPGLNITDWFASEDGKGMINILDCRQLMHNGTMYATFLLWMMSELFETLPEVGDLDKPRMVFFFDEAHLLFKDCSKALQAKIEQVVKLIRSKGVGIYFITQNPKDIPDDVLSQLGNKIQHALRAYTPADEKAVKAAAASFRTNPAFDTKEVLTSLGTGEALVSVLDAEGIPTVVRRCNILPPQSLMGSISDGERQNRIVSNMLYLRYKDMVDRDSAYEFFQRLKGKETEDREREAAEKEAAKQAAAAEKEAARQAAAAEKEAARQAAAAEKEAARQAAAEQKKAAAEQAKKEKAMKAGVKSVASTAAGTIGREVGNSLGKSVGGNFGKKIGGNVGASLGRSILGTFFKM